MVKELEDKYIFTYKRIFIIRLGKYRLSLEKRIAYDTKERRWKSV